MPKHLSDIEELVTIFGKDCGKVVSQVMDTDILETRHFPDPGPEGRKPFKRLVRTFIRKQQLSLAGLFHFYQ